VSYILDALRKSDQARRRGAAPTLLLGQAPAAVPKRPAPIAYGVIALVLLCIGMAIGWLYPWQKRPPAPASPVGMVQAPRPNPAPAAIPGKAPLPETQAHNAAPAAPPVSVAAQARAPVPAPEPTRATAAATRARPGERGQLAPPKAAGAVTAKATQKAQEAALRNSGGAAAPLTGVTSMAQLPVEVQQELPPMTVSVHAYSGRAADRLVDINGRLLHEGDSVAPGLRLEQITPNGMILSYKGYTFHRGVR